MDITSISNALLIKINPCATDQSLQQSISAPHAKRKISNSIDQSTIFENPPVIDFGSSTTEENIQYNLESAISYREYDDAIRIMTKHPNVRKTPTAQQYLDESISELIDEAISIYQISQKRNPSTYESRFIQYKKKFSSKEEMLKTLLKNTRELRILGAVPSGYTQTMLNPYFKLAVQESEHYEAQLWRELGADLTDDL